MSGEWCIINFFENNTFQIVLSFTARLSGQLEIRGLACFWIICSSVVIAVWCAPSAARCLSVDAAVEGGCSIILQLKATN